MISRNQFSHAVLGLALALSVGLTARADDTEIFEGTPSSSQRPNVLFIIDTSGSMDTDVKVRPDYDPKTTYTGSCDKTVFYWKLKPTKGTPTPPSCSGNKSYIEDSPFVCKTARSEVAKTGVYTLGRVAQWSSGSKKWIDLASGVNSEYVECEGDETIDHGLVDNDRKVAANAANGPFTTSTALGISWKGYSYYVFYSGNYLNYYETYGSLPATKTRLQIVKDATKRIIDSPNLDATNVGLMQFNSNVYFSGDPARGGFVIYPFTQIETARGATALPAVVDGLKAESWTPLSETLYEAYQYLTGGSVVYGIDSTPSVSVAGSRVGDTTTSTKYKKTIDKSCEETYLVYLTDGQPTRDADATTAIESIIGKACTGTGVAGDDNVNGICLDELAEYMHTNDLYVDPTLPAATQPKETVTTYTIGFGDDVPGYAQKLLEDTALKGGGENFQATDDASLLEAFQAIASDIQTVNVTFTAPTVSVNAFNRTRTLDDLFFSVFQPGRTYHWAGNLKKYRVDGAGVLRDANTASAVDNSTGYFKASSQSFWSTTVDGSDVTAGGAANLLPTSRKIYTNLGTAPTTLSAVGNQVVDSNTAITRDMLGLPAMATPPSPDTARTNLIDWVRGADQMDVNNDGLKTDSRHQMGDPLHAQPASVVYGKDGSGVIQGVVYTATNDGYLHAIDSTTGTELWSFIPKDLLLRMSELQTNDISGKRYGLDGSISVYQIDKNGDGYVNKTVGDGDKVYLFFGMGRGGRNYYALDVTDKDNPIFMWSNGSSGTLTGMGETWSTPVVTKISMNISGTVTKKTVMIVGGGYDPTQDGGNALPAVQAQYHTDVVGNHIYFLDALTGAELWRAGPTSDTLANFQNASMVSSFPADIRVIDMDSDGLADRMYAGDMGGRVWRFDIINGQTAANLVRGGVFASLGYASGASGMSNPADARRFYSAPDASILRANGTSYVNLLIGSGFRGHPLNTNIEDRIYSLRDPIVFRPMTAAEYTALTPIYDNSSKLIDVTTNPNATMPADAVGWKIKLGTGEKVLVESLTVDGIVILPVFSSTTTTTTFSCSALTGTNILYTINSGNGSAANDRDANGTISVADRRVQLKQQGIAPSAVLLFPSASSPIASTTTTPPTCNPTDPLCVAPPSTMPTANQCSNGMTPPTVVAYTGAETVPVTLHNCPVKTFWQQGSSE